MVAAGNDSVVMEATSHGLALERTRNCRFDVGVVTNVTSEHLEFHGTLEAYRAAKARLFEEAPIAILNADDPAFDYFRGRARDRVVTYGIEADADLRATDIDADADGTPLHAVSPGAGAAGVTLPMPGGFNVTTRWRPWRSPRCRGSTWRHGRARARRARPACRAAWSGSTPGQPFSVIVDYAHTADSLGKVLRMLRPVSRGRLIAVFGSAGERDPTKRAPMGRVAAELADLAIVTDEDPRLEDPRTSSTSRSPRARARPVPWTARIAVGHRRPARGDRARHRPGARRRRDPAGRQGPRGEHLLRHREAAVGRPRAWRARRSRRPGWSGRMTG